MKTTVNLLPWQVRSSFKKNNRFKKQLLIISGVILFSLTLWHMILLRQINAWTKKMNHLQQSLILAEQYLENRNRPKEPQQKMNQINSKSANLEKKRLSFIHFFENLHQGIPANLRLTKIVIKGGGIKLFGNADSIFGITQLGKALNQAIIQKIDRQDDEYSFILELHCGS